MKFVVNQYVVFLALFMVSCSGDSEERVSIERTSRLDEFIRIPTDQEGNIKPEEMAKLHFSEDHFKYDTIEQGEIVEHSFSFTNTGKSALLITSVKSSCGCTVASYPEDPIQPGKGGEILAKFNSKDKEGPQINEISIYSNAYPNKSKVSLSGFVLSEK
jgi:hypothetical protein